MLVFTSLNNETTVTANSKNLNAGIRISMRVEGSIKTMRQGRVIFVYDDTGMIGTVIK